VSSGDRLEPSATIDTALIESVGGLHQRTVCGDVAILDKPAACLSPGGRRCRQAGLRQGEATVELVEQNGTTIVNVSGTVQTGGPIARVGQRLLGTVSKMMMDRFFGCLQERAKA
jgi:carbon monoxide dehydrogenase subunit G